MANKKLKNFEFANHTEKGKIRQVNTDEVVFFECANGSVFLLCQDNEEKELETSPAKLAAQRMKYYLENEYVANPTTALSNALIYTNGFIYEFGRKNDEYKNACVHCACILIRDNQAYYAAFGETAIFFYNGKKIHLLALGEQQSDANVQYETEKTTQQAQGFLLGKTRDIIPEVNTEPLLPVNGDMILLASKGFYARLSDRNILKVISDPMPVQTKIYRFVDLASIAGGDENISIQLISFYNLDQQQREFKPIEARRLVTPKRRIVADRSVEANAKLSGGVMQQYGEKYLTGPVRITLIVIGALLLAYMVYDLFIYNPMPPVETSRPQEETIVGSESAEVMPEMTPQARQTPADVVYVVKSGDTWGRIYSRFGVCSWFIRNHADNSRKLDSDDNPVAGRSLDIPLVYSSKKELNPDFYQEFSLEKTGSRCENANQAFLDAFKAANF